MCGHVGILSRKMEKNHVSFFEQALFADQLRGDHGTGVAFFDKDFSHTMLKKAMGVSDFIDLKSYSSLAKDSGLSSKFIMGHNRYATKGGISNKTSHPFNYGDVIMAHNGSLTTQYQLPESKDFPVDSENIAYSLDKIGVEETISKLEGSYSLVWANTKDKTVNFIRNKHRPMIFGLSKDKKTLLYASEHLMLEWIAWRNGIELDSISSTEEDILYTFDMNLSVKEELKPKTKKIEGYKFKQLTYKGQNNKTLIDLGLSYRENVEFTISTFDAYRGGQLRGALSGHMNSEPWAEVIVYSFFNLLGLKKGDVACGDISGCKYRGNKSEDELIIIDPNTISEVDIWEDLKEKDDPGETGKVYRGPGIDLLTSTEFKKLTNFGCSSCQANLFHDNHEEITWLDGKTPLCPSCSKKACH